MPTLKWRLVFLSVSALALILVGLVCVEGTASLQRHVLESARGLLEGSARTIEAELTVRGRSLAELSEQVAADPELADALHPGAEADHRIQKFHGVRPDIDAMTLVNEDGVIVATNARHLHVGDSLATGRGDAKAAPRAAVPGRPGLMDSVLAGYPARGVSFLEGGVTYWGAAPIYISGSVVGAVLMERRLRSLPEVSGCDAFLVVDGKVAAGKARDGWLPFVATGPDKSFLMFATDTTVRVPLFGAIKKQPMFVDSSQVGVWAQRFAVPGSAASIGFVTIDLTPEFSELAGFQLMVVILMMFVWMAHAALLFTASRSSPVEGDRPEESPAESFRRLVSGVRQQLKEGLLALRRRLDRRGGPPADSSDGSSGTIVSPSPAGADNEAFGTAPAPANGDEPDDMTPPLGVRVQARLEALADPAPYGEAEPVNSSDEDATSAMLMTPELMAELDRKNPHAEAGQETQVMNVTEELMAEVKAGLVSTARKLEVIKPEAPKAEAPKVEAPKAEAPKAEAPKIDLPKIELPKAEAPRIEPAKIEAPKIDLPKLDLAKPSVPKIELPKIDLAKAELPKPELPKIEPPKPELPKAGVPKLELPKLELPKLELPKMPKAETPKAEAPKAEVPKTDAPKLEAAIASDQDEPFYRDLFRQLTTMRKVCGEMDEVSFEDFKRDLEATRAAVMTEQNCKEVRFRVVVQGGKAVLAPTPVLAV